MLKQRDVAQMIDVSAVRTHHGISDIEEVVGYAKDYTFINVHVLPNWVSTLAGMIKDVPDVYVGSPVGFPSGAHTTEVKLLEAKKLVADGVQEMDIVMNVGRFKSKQYDYVLDELKQIIALKTPDIKTKVLIELNCLTDEEMIKACELVAQTDADFLKTGTGWVPGGANIDRVKVIKQVLPSTTKVKVAGGIRTRDEFLQLYDLGVERFGINTQSAMEIVQTFDK
ncbi:MAG: deoxyribose-phosphate aldolase [Eubacteriales bacterium]